MGFVCLVFWWGFASPPFSFAGLSRLSPEADRGVCYGFVGSGSEASFRAGAS